MSHHFDSPTAIEDGRINLCDLYAFPGRAGTTVLLMTVNPDAGRSNPTTFRPDAIYEFAAASRGADRERLALRVRFASPNAGDGEQTYDVVLAIGDASHAGAEGLRLVSGTTNNLAEGVDGVRSWAGEAADPFWGNGFALAQFHQGLQAGQYRSELFRGEQSNVFAGRNVSAIAIEIPDSMLGHDLFSLWARVSLYGHATQRWVSRMGQPMLRPLFFPIPGEDSENLNAGSPRTDVAAYRGKVVIAAATVAGLNGRSEAEHANAVAHAFLPDVLRYEVGEPARFAPGGGNGRALNDDAFGIALSTFVGEGLGATTAPNPVNPEFPHLAAPNRDDLPSLADMFGLRTQQAESA
jgi:hypothetical protein